MNREGAHNSNLEALLLVSVNKRHEGPLTAWNRECSLQRLYFEHPEDAGQYVADCLRPDDAVLFKASRGVALERALALVQKQFGDAESLSATPVVAMKERP